MACLEQAEQAPSPDAVQRKKTVTLLAIVALMSVAVVAASSSGDDMKKWNFSDVSLGGRDVVTSDLYEFAYVSCYSRGQDVKGLEDGVYVNCKKICFAGHIRRQVYGKGPFSLDSNVCLAAFIAGAVTVNGGMVFVKKGTNFDRGGLAMDDVVSPGKSKSYVMATSNTYAAIRSLPIKARDLGKRFRCQTFVVAALPATDGEAAPLSGPATDGEAAPLSGPATDGEAAPLSGPATHKNTLLPGEKLHAGEQLQSRNGDVKAIMQGDGNFVIYRAGRAIWNTATMGHNSAYFIFQSDVLVVYNHNRAIWDSATHGRQATKLVLENNGDLVLYNGNMPTWNSFGARSGRI